ncbi:monofunctional biosynthetic peptidoglycan transglycosylase [Chitinophaga terrae (ex Kim and Jung 2007)]|uniref:Biosynthetic peptidoglycan transglycosylase n=1 Tax=Chitinophaga terrae (ex Kim and Jung 2007) TaxID=408074 RepID=A0A1H4E960_9BACT|nr:monofunctional biosynthetic peptidoglycan transglycosylase [Chitinophaga terrae (ex Kim and Jung 2007)]GEP91473.1 monofunctional biosynthetic peptidoglycan transglycosylase [Chitinophaga terrae (ex Kim and Jung 2007)]SEA81573.1 monofunctional biosynthetic peptidoglycan transglycosylase [Chitinophaga terrae (ex Kim and Jung 2007)]
MELKGIVPRTWRRLKRILLILFIAQFVYIFILKWINPPITITLIGSWISLWGTDKKLQKTWVDYDQISQHAKLAVIASEDQLFTDHNGFDFKSIEKAMKHNQKSKKIKGASTISQQVAKNVFLWQGRSWFRKGLEVYFTFMIEKIWGKQRILEVYLNVAEMGEGIFGVEAASQNYFHKNAASLNREEAAMIAACLPNPIRYTIVPPARITVYRQRKILIQMRNLAPDPDITELVTGK